MWTRKIWALWPPWHFKWGIPVYIALCFKWEFDYRRNWILQSCSTIKHDDDMACKCCPNYLSFFPGDPPMTIMMACEGNAFRITGPCHFMNYKSNIVLRWLVFFVNQILHDVLPSHRSLIAFIRRLISLRHFRRSPKSILSFWFI